MVRRTLLVLLATCAAAACSRSSARPQARASVTRPATTRAPAQPAAQTPVQPGAATPVIRGESEEDEQREIMAAMRNMSAFPDTADGARGFATALAHEAIRHDRDGWERLKGELVADNTRFELAFTFDGSRRLRDRVVPGLEARAEDVKARLAAMREPVSVNVTSALGSELADGSAHGFDPAIASVRTMVRPAVRFYHVEVVGAGGQRVTLEPMAWLGGRWTWLGEPWTALAPTPVVPVAPPAVPSAR